MTTPSQREDSGSGAPEPARDRLLAVAIGCGWPLLVWAAHFFGAYVAVAVGCIAAGGQGAPRLEAALLVASALVLALLARATWTAWRAWRAASPPSAGHAALRCALALLTLVGVAWSTVPLVLLPACHAAAAP